MASVIWLLYLADLVGSLSGVLGIGGGAVIIGYLAYRAGHAMAHDFESDPPAPAKPKQFIVPAAAAIAIACLLPSQTTIYALAAYSAGDKALQTETGSKAVQALNAWLDAQIAKNADKKN